MLTIVNYFTTCEHAFNLIFIVVSLSRKIIGWYRTRKRLGFACDRKLKLHLYTASPLALLRAWSTCRSDQLLRNYKVIWIDLRLHEHEAYRKLIWLKSAWSLNTDLLNTGATVSNSNERRPLKGPSIRRPAACNESKWRHGKAVEICPHVMTSCDVHAMTHKDVVDACNWYRWMRSRHSGDDIVACDSHVLAAVR